MSKDELITIAIDEITGFKKGTILEFKKTARSFSLSDSDLFDCVLLPLLVADKIYPIYKLNTNKHFPNDWVVSLFSLEKEFRLKDGTILDGTKTKNILSAYQVK